jgi:uncharacterized membrane protein YtjA (UPF0391 family)
MQRAERAPPLPRPPYLGSPVHTRNFRSDRALYRHDHSFHRKGISAMLRYALIFLVVALVAGLLGFGGLAGAAVGIAKILFYIFIILFVVGLVMHLVRGGRTI